MKINPTFLARVKARRSQSEASALVIVLSFVVLLTVVVLAMFSHSLLNRLISNSSANVTKADLYGHGAIDQIIGDLEQEIVAGSTGSNIGLDGSSHPNTLYPTGGTTNAIYRPAMVMVGLSPTFPSAVPSNAGPSSYTASSVWSNPNLSTPSTAGLLNLVKQSTYNVAFYPATIGANAPMRAAPVSTASQSLDSAANINAGSADGTSLNGHYVSMARWNKALLLPKASPQTQFSGGTGGTGITVTDTGTITTPIASFVAPDWILTAADGTNPTTLDTSNSLTTSNVLAKSPKYIVGRYAYTIYNEGGLLDVNVAGSPASATTTLTAAQLTLMSKKGPAAFADLTQLPGIADLTTLEGGSRGQAIVDSLVGWRNAATAQATVSPYFPRYRFTGNAPANYFNYLLGLTTNFMSTGNTALANNLSDRIFTNRQQMISFFENVVPAPGALLTEQAYLQDAMMYLGTFSRSLNQPSYWPDPTRPLLTAYTSGGALTDADYQGGNNLYSSSSTTDNLINPPFKSIRVTSSFTRNDGTTAVVGEPLVKKRFALSRLMWLTYKGPSANVGTSDPLYQQYQNLYSGSGTTSTPASAMLAQLWNEGTTTNIQNYFGLTWTAGPGTGGMGGYWTYNTHTITTGASTGVIRTLSQVAAANREPDFFELLKAAICVGSLGKGFLLDNTDLIDLAADTVVDHQICQIVANMVDQFDPDSYPTQIVFTDANGTNNSFWGKEDLPYLSAIVPMGIYTANPTPPANATGSPAQTAPFNTLTSAINPNVTNGSGAILDVPVVWDPFSIAGQSVPTTLMPQNLRIAITNVSSAGLDNQSYSVGYNMTNTTGSICMSVAPAWNLGSPNASTGAIQSITTSNGSAGDTALYFSNPAYVDSSTPTKRFFRDPTPLVRPNFPSGSNLGLGSNPTNLLAVPTPVGELTGSGTITYLGFLEGTYSIAFSNLTTAPATPTTLEPVYYVNSARRNASGNLLTSPVSLEYSDGNGHWIPYMQYPNLTFRSTSPNPSLPYSNTGASTTPQFSEDAIAAWGAASGGWTKAYSSVTDPRTQRGGWPFDITLPSLDSIGDPVYVYPVIPSLRPAATYMPVSHGIGNPTEGFYSNYPAWSGGPGSPGDLLGNLCQNIPATAAPFFFYSDPDFVVRRAMFGGQPNWDPTSTTGTVGQPLANVTGTFTGLTQTDDGATWPSTIPNPSNDYNRPIMLNRPFRSVSELGYVGADSPWKNLDFFQPESGDSALLDVFCINEDYRPDAITAGRVDLNSKQAPVFQALLAGAYRDETTNQLAALTQPEAIAASQALVNRTTVGNVGSSLVAGTPQPLMNVADLIGRWVPGTHSIDQYDNSGQHGKYYNGASAYDGFSRDLDPLVATPYTPQIYDPSGAIAPTGSAYLLQRFRETTMRALSDAGQAGTWNLLIDVVAQSGRYPVTATGLSNFLVEGEHRYWVHVAIDRTTGQIVDESIEPVNE